MVIIANVDRAGTGCDHLRPLLGRTRAPDAHGGAPLGSRPDARSYAGQRYRKPDGEGQSVATRFEPTFAPGERLRRLKVRENGRLKRFEPRLRTGSRETRPVYDCAAANMTDCMNVSLSLRVSCRRMAGVFRLSLCLAGCLNGLARRSDNTKPTPLRGRGDQATFSRSSRAFFLGTPHLYPLTAPFVPTTRWHGTASATGLLAQD